MSLNKRSISPRSGCSALISHHCTADVINTNDDVTHYPGSYVIKHNHRGVWLGGGGGVVCGCVRLQRIQGSAAYLLQFYYL